MITKAGLRAVRAQAIALAEQIEAMLAEEAPPPPNGGCEHPAEQRRDVPRMGAPRAWLCLKCGQTHDAAGVAAGKEG